MLIHPQSELIREPNFLIPGRKPIGPVKIAPGWGNNLMFAFVAQEGSGDPGALPDGSSNAACISHTGLAPPAWTVLGRNIGFKPDPLKTPYIRLRDTQETAITAFSGLSEVTLLFKFNIFATSITRDHFLLSEFNTGGTGLLIWVDDVAATAAVNTFSFAWVTGGGGAERISGASNLASSGDHVLICRFKGSTLAEMWLDGKKIASDYSVTNSTIGDSGINTTRVLSSDHAALRAEIMMEAFIAWDSVYAIPEGSIPSVCKDPYQILISA